MTHFENGKRENVRNEMKRERDSEGIFVIFGGRREIPMCVRAEVAAKDKKAVDTKETIQ